MNGRGAACVEWNYRGGIIALGEPSLSGAPVKLLFSIGLHTKAPLSWYLCYKLCAAAAAHCSPCSTLTLSYYTVQYSHSLVLHTLASTTSSLSPYLQK